MAIIAAQVNIQYYTYRFDESNRASLPVNSLVARFYVIFFAVVDLVMPSFNGTSYLKYPGLGSAFLSFIEILISFKPLDPDGLFFYNGFKTDGTGDFISLSLSGGFVELRFDLGNGPAIIRSMEPISLHEWHTVFLSRTGRAGLLEVDNQPRIEGLSKGAFTQLSLPQHLYIGGVPSFEIISHKVGVKSSFRGCVQKVKFTISNCRFVPNETHLFFRFSCASLLLLKRLTLMENN